MRNKQMPSQKCFEELNDFLGEDVIRFAPYTFDLTEDNRRNPYQRVSAAFRGALFFYPLDQTTVADAPAARKLYLVLIARPLSARSYPRHACPVYVVVSCICMT